MQWEQKKSRIFSEHQPATVAEYAKTYARFRAFLKKLGVDVVDAIVEELDGASECIVTQFFCWMRQHITTSPFFICIQISAMTPASTGTKPLTHSSTVACICNACGEVRSLWCFFIYFGCCIKSDALTGVILDAIYKNELTLEKAKAMVDPSVSKHSFYALITM
jgi:hypothetical protein